MFYELFACVILFALFILGYFWVKKNVDKSTQPLILGNYTLALTDQDSSLCGNPALEWAHYSGHETLLGSCPARSADEGEYLAWPHAWLFTKFL